MNSLALVFIGGGLGAVARHLTVLGALRALGSGFPWGTLAVNISGSFAIGFLAAWLLVRDQGELRLFLTTGFLGGFTTFSAFSLDAWALWQRGDAALATGYVAASVFFSIAGVFAGLALGRALS